MAKSDEVAQLKAELEAAKKELEAARKRAEQKAVLVCKVSKKGAVSLYGLGRWPMTLYKEQWERVLQYAEKIREFIREHDGELKAKGDKDGEKAA